MRALILGVGDAFTTTGFGSGVLLEGPGGYLMVDCADLIHRALAEASKKSGWNVDATQIHDVVLTHLHGDHCNGLESFGFKRYAERLRGESTIIPRLWTHPGAAERVWERLAPAMDAPLTQGGPRATLADFFELHTFDPDHPAEIAGLTVACRYTVHPVPTVGLMISNGRSTLGLSGDTKFDPEHVQWLSRADVIIHEANYSPLHTGVNVLNELPREIRDKLILTHTEDAFDPTSTDIPLLYEGQVLEF